MAQDSNASFNIIFRYLDALGETEEAKESAALSDEVEEIAELRRMVDEAEDADCVEFTTT